MDVSLIHQSHGDGLRWISRVSTGYKPYHHDMVEVEAKNHFRLDYTSISYVYEVFKHILVNGHMDVSPIHQSHGGGLIWLTLGKIWVQTVPL